MLRKILQVPFSTPSEAYFLELGILPIGVIVKARRANYLHYLLKRDKHEMLNTFFMTQWFDETVGDWTQQIRLDLEDLDIPCNFEFIRSKSATAFKELVKRKAKEYALKILTEKRIKHSKMDNLHYSELRLQTYFKTPGIQTKEVLNLFKWRVGMAPLGENFRGNGCNIMCPLCGLHLDNQQTILM